VSHSIGTILRLSVASTTALIQRGSALFDDQQYEESIQTLSAALVRPGTSQQDIALALMAATRKLGTTKAAPDRENEMRQARQAADAILGGDKVVLEGASPDSVESIAEDLRKAGLLVTTSK